jgi:hypothetical protein
LIGIPEIKRPLGRLIRTRQDNIKMNLREIGCGMVWIPVPHILMDDWLLKAGLGPAELVVTLIIGLEHIQN